MHLAEQRGSFLLFILLGYDYDLSASMDVNEYVSIIKYGDISFWYILDMFLSLRFMNSDFSVEMGWHNNRGSGNITYALHAF